MLNKRTITFRTLVAMMAFGLFMGLIFPIYASIFVDFKPGMQLPFILGCIAAGFMVGGFSYWLVHLIIFRILRIIPTGSDKIARDKGDLTFEVCCPKGDVIGDVVDNFSRVVQKLFNCIFSEFLIIKIWKISTAV